MGSNSTMNKFTKLILVSISVLTLLFIIGEVRINRVEIEKKVYDLEYDINKVAKQLDQLEECVAAKEFEEMFED